MGGLRAIVLTLLIIGTIVGGLLVLPNLQTADRVGGVQLPAGWPFVSAREMEPEIGRLFGCTLEQTPRESQCLSSRTLGLVSVDIDPMHGEAIKFTSMVLISRDDAPNPEEERISINTVMQFMDYIFPNWVERRTWMSLALQQARDRHANSAIELEGTVLHVDYEVPLGLPEQRTFAFITMEPAVSSSGIDNHLRARP